MGLTPWPHAKVLLATRFSLVKKLVGLEYKLWERFQLTASHICQCEWLHNSKKRMHSSRMHTVRYSGRLGGTGCLPGGCLPGGSRAEPSRNGSHSYSTHWDTYSIPGLSPTNANVCTSTWIKKGAILGILSSAGVAPGVNLRNPLHTGKEAHKWGMHPGFEIHF